MRAYAIEANQKGHLLAFCEALYRTRTVDPPYMRSETVAVGCRRLRIGLFEPFAGVFHLPLVATGCARRSP